jgi:hypothetical protein
MYLTNTREGAVKYSELRTTDPAARRVYSVQIDLSKLRVLDLTKDPRWLKDLKVIEPHLKGANENYGRAFQNFLRVNKIDLNQYDVVIGADYQRGGTQMCVLDKNGAPTPLNAKLRKSFQPVPTVHGAGASNAPRRIAIPHAVKSGLKMAGAAAGLTLLRMWLMQRLEKKIIEQGLQRLEPIITAAVQKRIAPIAAIQVKGRKAYANITIVIISGSNMVGPTAPGVGLELVEISEENINLNNRKTRTQTGPGSATHTQPFTYSFEVAVSAEVVELARAFTLELEWIKTEMMKRPSVSLMDAEFEIRSHMIRVFGESVIYEELFPYWMPKWKKK